MNETSDRNGGNVTLNAGGIVSGLDVVTLAEAGASGSVSLVGTTDLLIQAVRLITSAQVEITFADDDIRSFVVGNSGQSGSITISSTEGLSLENVEILSDAKGAISAGVVNLLSPRNINFFNSQIITDTSGNGNGGSVIIQTPELIINDTASGIFSRTNGGGDAGSITLQPFPFNANQNIVITALFGEGQFFASTSGQGAGGDINIKDAEFATFYNVGLVTNTIGSGPAGSINVENVDTLILRDSSFLLADAGGNEDGGDININADFVVAIPRENSDIIVNAIQGRGGDIDITATGVYGFTQRSDSNTEKLRNNDTSDLSADSEFGEEGIIALNTLVTDPSEGLDSLEEGDINPEDLISNSCIARNTVAEGSFTIPGAGSLPQTPEDSLNSFYTTSDVQALEAVVASEDDDDWQLGDPIVEPADIIQQSDGRFVFTYHCDV